MDQQIIRIAHRHAGHLVDIALGDKQIGAAIVVHIGETGVPSGRRAAIAGHIGALRIGADVIGRAAITPVRLRHLHQLVPHRGEHQLVPLVARQVTAGDPHPPKRNFGPAIRFGQEPLFGDVPHLLGPAGDIIVSIIGDSQRFEPTRILCGKHRQGAIPRRQLLRGISGRGAALGREQRVAITSTKRPVGIGAVNIMADSKRGKGCAILPPGGEGGGPLIGLRDAPCLCHIGELAIRAALKHAVRPDAHDI